MYKVAIIEDEPHIRELVTFLVRSEGYETLEAGSAETGLELIRNGSPHLVILDLVLGPDDGREVFRGARMAGYAGPIIILSAFGARAAAKELGAESWMEKPFDADILLKEVSRLLPPSAENV